MNGVHVNEFLTFNLADQIFGVSVLQVNDVLGPQRITRMPLAPPAISGVMNLRGRIVTAVDVRRCLGQKARDEGATSMSVVVEENGELFSLIIDSVRDVLSISQEQMESIPATLDPAWQSVASSIHKLEDRLVVILDVRQLLQMTKTNTVTQGEA
jgi:purine-binding chemotaxis protein CheW